jgi:hypothetical protein
MLALVMNVLLAFCMALPMEEMKKETKKDTKLKTLEKKPNNVTATDRQFLSQDIGGLGSLGGGGLIGGNRRPIRGGFRPNNNRPFSPGFGIGLALGLELGLLAG